MSISLLSQEKSFAINSQTIFFNEQGQSLSFDDFTYITSNYKNTLLPSFQQNGELEYITIRYPDEANKFIGSNIVSEKNTVFNNQFSSSATSSEMYSTTKELTSLLAPDFNIQDQYGQLVSLKKLNGTVVVLKFWFSKCAPCIEEMPTLNNLVNNNKNKNVKFYAPSVERKSLTESFLNENSFSYNVFYEAQDLAALYKVPGYPTHIVIGKDGIVRKVLVGKNTNVYKILNEEIKRALLVQIDDIDVLEIDDNESFVLNDETIIYNENGERINKEEYIYRLNTGRYKVYKKIKKNGKTNLLITLKN